MDSFFTQLSIWMEKFPSYAPFVMIIAIMTFILYKAHKSSEQKFTIYDLIEDPVTGHGSLEKVGMLTAMLTLTWWFVDLAASSKATVEEAVTYGGIMGLAKFANAWLSAKYGQPIATTTKDDK